VNTGHLPPGFLAIDLARHLELPLYDPELQVDVAGTRRYMRVDPTIARARSDVRQRLTTGAALIGGNGRIGRPTDATVIVAQTSVYVPNNDRSLVQRIVRFLATQDYVGGLFVNDRHGQMAGALQMSQVGLIGSATTPKPAVVISFKSFALDAANPHMSGVIVGGVRQHGQGDHGSLARANTFNNMAAMGPDFKRRFVDQSPVSNADVAPTLAQIMRMKIPSLGKLRGRVIREALARGPAATRTTRATAQSRPSENSMSTVLMYQVADDRIYLDEACFTTAAACK
jgi:hypothetical protein